MGIEIFKNRSLVIATKHKKEQVIAPLLERTIGVNCKVPTLLDTDKLGTFSGEIERKLNPLETARVKCNMAMDETGLDLAVSSEGSFGQHPSIIFSAADDEIILLVDRKNNLEIKGRKISTDTNFGGQKINTIEEGLEFAEKHGFPNHALILRNEQNSHEVIYKNIMKQTQLIDAMGDLFKNANSAWIETDMRALYNPKRMRVIKEATENLLQNILRICPECDTPGFQVDGIESGLPCDLCGMPTRSTLAFNYKCQICKHTEKEFNPNGKEKEDPMYCDICNP